MFTVLVGRPGLGKGGALNPAASILREANTTNLLSDRVTIEYVLEKLSKGFPSQQMQPGGGLSFGTDACTCIFSPELSIFITASQHTLPILADLWDASEGEFSYGTRHKGDYRIKNSCVAMLGGSTQEWLISSIPSNAVGGGFTRRCNFVFGKDRAKAIPWPLMNGTDIRLKLVNDLRHMSVLRGEFKFTKDAKDLFDEYYTNIVIDEFDDEATTAYKTTRWAHATKLAMCLSASQRDDLLITDRIFLDAINRINDVLDSISLVFRAVGESDLAEASDRVLRFLENKGFATKSDILRANWRHISVADLDAIIQLFLQGGFILERQQGNKIIYEIVPAKIPKAKAAP